jgi:hypothetical protein
MNTTTTNQGLVITAPSSLLQFCAHMDKVGNYLKTYTDKLDRATQFIVRQYENSALAKQRAAKQNLTAACNAAQARVRKTLHQIAATFTDHNSAPTDSELRALVHEHLRPKNNLQVCANNYKQQRQANNTGLKRKKSVLVAAKQNQQRIIYKN